MKGIKQYILLVFVLFTLSACSNSMSLNEYKDWVTNPDNGLLVQKERGRYFYELQFQPSNLLHGSSSEPEVSKEGLQQYILTIGIQGNKVDFIKEGTNDLMAIQKKEYYFSYQFQEHIYLEESGEKIPCILFHFEKTVNLKNSRTFVLGFPNVHDAKESTVVINSPLLSDLPLKFKINKRNIPTLKNEAFILN